MVITSATLVADRVWVLVSQLISIFETRPDSQFERFVVASQMDQWPIPR